MTEVFKTVWKKAEGYKTASAGVLVLLFQLFQLIWPDALQEQWEDWIYNAIGVVCATGIIDKIWRSRHKIKDLFTRKNGGENEKFEGGPEQNTSGR